ncbi:MAG: hypothetical protein KF781_10620 [Chitinophagaceae bacterium]|nr:hypothetical protein [Chitinophagaceae bacterium]MCW5906114.1 hypothetical protein [Chitinophagaceae bacterium]
MKVINYAASGKLLLFGEYLVLRGSTCLAMPLSVGQNLSITNHSEQNIVWQCFDENKNCWLSIQLSNTLQIIETTDTDKALIVQKLLQLIQKEKPTISLNNLHFKFEINFNRAFGFGTSATLISLLSQWSGVDAYYLLAQTFEGSGYDIATAISTKPIIYSVKNKIEKTFSLPPSITQYLLFVYLGKKQISSKEINAFKHTTIHQQPINKMNEIVLSATQCNDIKQWEKLMNESEKMLSTILATITVKEKYFADYSYAIKSLGAWGGDFIMVTCRNIDEAKKYFQQKNKQPIFTYNELIQ